MKEIYSAFAKAQGQFNKAVKDSKNPHFKSNYANIESVIDAISKALHDNNLAFLQPISSDENRYYICTQLVHSSGEMIESPKCEIIIQDKNNPQKFGSSLTYFRRYSLMAFFGIPDTDDDGNSASEGSKEKPKEQNKPKNHAPQVYVMSCGKFKEGTKITDLQNVDIQTFITLCDKAISEGKQLPPEYFSDYEACVSFLKGSK